MLDDKEGSDLRKGNMVAAALSLRNVLICFEIVGSLDTVDPREVKKDGQQACHSNYLIYLSCLGLS